MHKISLKASLLKFSPFYLENVARSSGIEA